LVQLLLLEAGIEGWGQFQIPEEGECLLFEAATQQQQ
jgi:hypothetical protein